MTGLSGEKALVLGAGHPSGRAIAIALAEAGADVCVASLTASRAEEFAVNSAANEIWALQRKGKALVVNASDPAQVSKAIADALDEMGGLTIVIIHADGIRYVEQVAGAVVSRLSGADNGCVVIVPSGVLPADVADELIGGTGILQLAESLASRSQRVRVIAVVDQPVQGGTPGPGPTIASLVVHAVTPGSAVETGTVRYPA